MLRKLMNVLYMMVALGANQSLAQTTMVDFPKLAVHSAPREALPAVTLLDETGAPSTLEAYRGKWVVLNFWATWCGPCRTEMPALDRLQAELPDIAVVPVATGRNPLPGLVKFFKTAEVKNLPILRDTTSKLAAYAGVRGLPVTLILNPKGQEVARLIGDAKWDGPAALAAIQALQQQAVEDGGS